MKEQLSVSSLLVKTYKAYREEQRKMYETITELQHYKLLFKLVYEENWEIFKSYNNEGVAVWIWRDLWGNEYKSIGTHTEAPTIPDIILDELEGSI